MAASQLEAFARQASADAQLRSRLESSKSFGDITAIAKDAGYEITEADLLQARSAARRDQDPELSEDELDKVSGGVALLLAYFFMAAGTKTGGHMDRANKL